MKPKINWHTFYSQIPSSVKIGQNQYNVLYTDGFPDDPRQLGQSSFDEEKQIIINLNQPIKEFVHTYIHEILHCISYEYDVDLTERQVIALESALKDVVMPRNLFKKKVGKFNGKK